MTEQENGAHRACILEGLTKKHNVFESGNVLYFTEAEEKDASLYAEQYNIPITGQSASLYICVCVCPCMRACECVCCICVYMFTGMSAHVCRVCIHVIMNNC